MCHAKEAVKLAKWGLANCEFTDAERKVLQHIVLCAPAEFAEHLQDR